MSHDYGALVSQFREALTRQRYNPVVVHNYCRNADYFLCYLEERKIALKRYRRQRCRIICASRFDGFVSAAAAVQQAIG